MPIPWHPEQVGMPFVPHESGSYGGYMGLIDITGSSIHVV
jgi:hypothetical protein